MSLPLNKSSSTEATFGESTSSKTSLSQSTDNKSTLGKSPSIVDSYSETNKNEDLDDLQGIGVTKAGQAFTTTQGTLDSCKFFLTRSGTCTGNITASLYAMTGNYGTTAIPTGSALATSDPIDASTISNSIYQLITFTFSGANRYSMVATHYIISVEYSGGGIGSFISVGGGTNNLPSGNPSDYSPWTAFTGNAYCFYVYAITGVTSNALSESSDTKTAVTKSS